MCWILMVSAVSCPTASDANAGATLGSGRSRSAAAMRVVGWVSSQAMSTWRSSPAADRSSTRRPASSTTWKLPPSWVSRLPARSTAVRPIMGSSEGSRRPIRAWSDRWPAAPTTAAPAARAGRCAGAGPQPGAIQRPRAAHRRAPSSTPAPRPGRRPHQGGDRRRGSGRCPRPPGRSRSRSRAASRAVRTPHRARASAAAILGLAS